MLVEAAVLVGDEHDAVQIVGGNEEAELLLHGPLIADGGGMPRDARGPARRGDAVLPRQTQRVERRGTGVRLDGLLRHLLRRGAEDGENPGDALTADGCRPVPRAETSPGGCSGRRSRFATSDGLIRHHGDEAS